MEGPRRCAPARCSSCGRRVCNRQAHEVCGYVDGRTGRATVLPWYEATPSWIDDRLRWAPPLYGFHTHPRRAPPSAALDSIGSPASRPHRGRSAPSITPPSGHDLVAHSIKAWPDRARLTTLVLAPEGTYAITNVGAPSAVWHVMDGLSRTQQRRAVLDARWARPLVKLARQWNARMDAVFPPALARGTPLATVVAQMYAPLGYHVELRGS